MLVVTFSNLHLTLPFGRKFAVMHHVRIGELDPRIVNTYWWSVWTAAL